MSDRPTAPELIEAVFEFLAGELLPTLDDHRMKFRTLVAMNALAIARRELEASNNLLLSPKDKWELARRIRAGEVPEDALPLLKEHVAAKLRISNPAYLEKYEGAGAGSTSCATPAWRTSKTAARSAPTWSR